MGGSPVLLYTVVVAVWYYGVEKVENFFYKGFKILVQKWCI